MVGLVSDFQQLSVLLATQASFPAAVLPWLAAVSAAGSFSFSAIVAPECVPLSLTLQSELWVAIGVLLAGIAACVLLPAAAACRSRGKDPFQRGLSCSDVVRRAGAMAFALLNVLFLPTAELSLAALACTDTREAGQTYLNLLPFVACDADWRARILPPAVLAVVLAAASLVPFALLLWLRGREGNGDAVESLRTMLGLHDRGFHDRVRWWNGVLLLRRFALVAIVAIVPYHSAVRLALCSRFPH